MSTSASSTEVTAACAQAAIDAGFATTTACSAMATHAFQVWAQTLNLALPGPPEPSRSWYRKPAWASDVPPSLPMAFGPFASGAAQPFTPDAFAKAWIEMISFQGSPSAWPMAFIMLAAGMPKSVAFPSAEANVAVIRMADQTAAAMRATFASPGSVPSTQLPQLPSPYGVWPWFGGTADSSARS